MDDPDVDSWTAGLRWLLVAVLLVLAAVLVLRGL